MSEIVFDIEANGFNPTKIHCLGVRLNDNIKAASNYANMKSLLSKKDNILIAHNCVRYDLPVLERLLGIKIKATIVDTLALSWYLYPTKTKHGLEEWGEYFGVPKPEVTDWDGQPIGVYLHRVKEDVKINSLLWDKMKRDLMILYESEEEMWRFIKYITFKMNCSQHQEEIKWKLDSKLAESTLELLRKKQQESFSELIKAMPSKPIIKKKKRPKEPYKRSGELSVHGEKWFALLKEQGLPEDTLETEVIDGYEEPKPTSHVQMKDWLYSLGWVPETFEFKRNKETGEVRQIPQIGIKNSGGDICDSIKKLYVKEPALEILEGLSIVTHRITVFEGFLRDVDEDGYIKAQVGGLTNTLRFKHRTLVNLIGVDKPYGKEVRGCLTCPDGYVLCGSDMSSLEDRTKQHYMWAYDPEYVKEMMTPDFDPHIDIAVHGGALTKQQGQDHKDGKADYGAIRKKFKSVNYAAVYGSGAATIARTAGVTESEAKKLLEAYWGRNWSVKAIAEDATTKKIGDQLWLYNPVSRFWYSLRYEKDIFSTLNQGTGVYCFDMWVKQMIKRGVVPLGQFHDEIISLVKIGDEERTKKILKDSVQAVNKVLKLNRDLDVDVQFGKRYSEIH
jgi:hypothetical protein